MAIILLSTSASLIFSPYSSFPSCNSSSITLVASLFFASTIMSSSIPSLFTIHKLCNTIHVTIIYDIFFNDISNRFIISLHLSFSIPNDIFTHILVENCMKFSFVILSDNAVFTPLNKQYIHGLTIYAASSISLYAWYINTIYTRPVFVIWSTAQ